MQRYRDVYEERKCKYDVVVKVYFESNFDDYFEIRIFLEFKIL